MIFVTVGTNEAPFDRLLAAFDSLDLDEKLVIQCGASSLRPSGAECVDFISFDELVTHVRAARVVVTHAGVGSVAVTLTNGKRPIVVARRSRFGEAVDDHQLAFARRFAASGQVRLLEDLDELSAMLRDGEDNASGHSHGSGGSLAAELRAFIGAAVASQTPRSVADPR